MTEFYPSPNKASNVPHQACVRDLNEELQLAKDGVRGAKARENSLKEDLETLNKDLQRSQKSHNKLQSEKEALEEHLNELKKKVQRLSTGLQVKTACIFLFCFCSLLYCE